MAILANFIDEFSFDFIVFGVQSVSQFDVLLLWDWVHSYVLLQCHFVFVYMVATLLEQQRVL